MRIKRIVVSNYRRLGDLDIDVRSHLVLIGANDVGKTSILRALNLALGPTAQLYQSLSIADIRDLELPFVVLVAFSSFNDSERALFHREIDIDKVDREEVLEVRLEVKVDSEDSDSVNIARWCPGRGEVRLLSRQQVASLGWRYLPALRQSSAAHLDGSSGAIYALLRAVESELGDEKKALSALLDSFNTKLDENQALTRLRAGMAEHLSNSMPRSVATSDLAVRTSADPAESVLENVSMFISRAGEFVPLSEQSDGIRQLIAMTLFDLAEDAANVIAIDEPELHLHPASQRTVADLLTKEANQKILVTHSPYIVQKFDPTQVVVVKADGSCHQLDATKVTVDERVRAHWWSPRMLEALTARFVIIVEGVADRIVVEAAARVRNISLDRIGAAMFELGGAANFPAVYKLLGPGGFNVDVLGLVDDAEKGPWLGAIGGRPTNVVGHTIFVSKVDLEDEYCRAVGSTQVAQRLINAGVARDMAALLSSCQAADEGQLTTEKLAVYCRNSSKSSIGNRKVPSALAISKALTEDDASKIASVEALLSELERRAGA